jgi:hypothetical protein
MDDRCSGTSWISCDLIRTLRYFLILSASSAAAGSADAQIIRMSGVDSDSASRVIERVLERGDHLLLDRDTTLGPDVRIAGDLVILDATVRLEGRIEGTVAVLGGELYIRPGAHIGGAVAVAAGAAYPSGLATTGPLLAVDPAIGVAVEADGPGYLVRLTAPPPPSRVRPDGVFGLMLPTHDRVNGLTVRLGSRVLLSSSEGGGFAHASVDLATERMRWGGRVGLEVPLGSGVRLGAELSRATLTNEGWVRGDLVNSLASIAIGSDARNYYESDAAAIELALRPAQPLIAGESFIGPRLVVRASRDRSLIAGDPWSATGGDWRTNPEIADGTLVSLLAGSSVAWRGATSALDGDLALEWAPPGQGDFEFRQLVAHGVWTMRSLWTHSIRVRGHTRLTLGGERAPPQRWSSLGGSGTIATLPFDARRGDNLVLVRSDYSVPVPGARVPLLGDPVLRVSHAVGTAWLSGDPLPAWDQNIGAGVLLGSLQATLWIDPAGSPLDPELTFGLQHAF